MSSSLDDFNNGKAPSSNAYGHPRTYIDPQSPLKNKINISTIRQALINLKYNNTDPLYDPKKIDNIGLNK